MPIEIREVLIRAVVDPQAGGDSSAPAASAPGGGEGQGGEQVVAEAVKKVFEMLREKEER